MKHIIVSVGDDNRDEQVRLLEAYLMSRRPLPGKSEAGNELQEEDKSTLDIVDDLKDMMDLDPKIVSDYMKKCRYGYTTSEDGKIKWAIWRNYQFPE